MISVVQNGKVLFRAEKSLDAGLREYAKVQNTLVDDGAAVAFYVHRTMTRAAKRVGDRVEERTLSGFREEIRSACPSCSTKEYEVCDACEKGAGRALVLWVSGLTDE